MNEKLNKLIAFSEKTFKTDAEISPLQQLVEDELEVTEVSFNIF